MKDTVVTKKQLNKTLFAKSPIFIEIILRNIHNLKNKQIIPTIMATIRIVSGIAPSLRHI